MIRSKFNQLIRVTSWEPDIRRQERAGSGGGGVGGGLRLPCLMCNLRVLPTTIRHCRVPSCTSTSVIEGLLEYFMTLELTTDNGVVVV